MNTDAELFSIGQPAARTGLTSRTIRFWSDAGLVRLLMYKLARLSAQERQQMIDDFVDGVFAGVDPQAPGAGIAGRMRQLPAELPDDPTPGTGRRLGRARRADRRPRVPPFPPAVPAFEWLIVALRVRP